MDIDILRQLFVINIENIDSKNRYDFRTWVSSQNYHVNSISHSKKAELYVRNPADYVTMLTSECGRYALASFESSYGIRQTSRFPKSNAWAIIRMYYSSFFAIHAILRMFGISCSHLEFGHIKIINDIASLVCKNTLSETAGLYTSVYDSNNSVLSIEKQNSSHQGAWKAFAKLIVRLKEDVLDCKGLTQNRIELSDYLGSIHLAITDDGNCSEGTWLSTFRNNVNYRHEYGAWFPYEGNRIKYKHIHNLILHANRGPATCINTSHCKSKISKFMIISSAIVYFCLLLIRSLASAHRLGNRALYNRVPLRFFNEAAQN